MKECKDAAIWKDNKLIRRPVACCLADDEKHGTLLLPNNIGLELGGVYQLEAADFRSEIAIASEADQEGKVEFHVSRPAVTTSRRSYLAPDEVNDRVFHNQPITVEEVANHYDGTTFWNYTGTVEEGLADNHRDQPFALSLSQSSEPNEDGYIKRDLRFDSGEITIDVATMYENIHADETCHEIDAAFVANLPAYMEALFREIYTLRKERGEAVAPAENDVGKSGVGRRARYMAGLNTPNKVMLLRRFKEFEDEIRQECRDVVTASLQQSMQVADGLTQALTEIDRRQAAMQTSDGSRTQEFIREARGDDQVSRICEQFRGLTLSWVEVMQIVKVVEQCAAGDPQRGVGVVLKPQSQQPVEPITPRPLVTLQSLDVGDRFAEDDDSLTRYVITMKHGGDVMARDEDTGEEQTFGNGQRVIKLPPKG